MNNDIVPQNEPLNLQTSKRYGLFMGKEADSHLFDLVASFDTAIEAIMHSVEYPHQCGLIFDVSRSKGYAFLDRVRGWIVLE